MSKSDWYTEFAIDGITRTKDLSELLRMIDDQAWGAQIVFDHHGINTGSALNIHDMLGQVVRLLNLPEPVLKRRYPPDSRVEQGQPESQPPHP
jgi:hypothetical protein